MPSHLSLLHALPGRAARLGIAAALACVLSPLPPSAASAVESSYVYKSDGSPMFELRFFGKGEAFMEPEEGLSGFSTWTLSEEQMNGVIEAARLWAEVLGPGSADGTLPSFNIGTFDDENAAAMSEPNSSAQSVVFTGLQGAIINGTPMEKPAFIAVGTLDFEMPEHLSPLPSTKGADYVGVLYHEVGHALGVASLAMDHAYGPLTQMTAWDSHLTDKYGTTLAPGISVVKEGEEGSVDGPKFVVGEDINSGVYFHGDHVSEVLGEGEGLLVQGYEGNDPDLSHIELERSLMSHQNYRNYTTFMEAELAALQDLGYRIDRRNFYGFSIYGDGETIVNENGYFARNEAGNAYLEGLPNTATLGTGLHIYGKNNTVTQAADLLACGTAGTGIRVDGSDNALTIADGVRIAANGAWGTGLLVAYGKNHAVVSKGDVTALGPGGIAARFDFGNNLLSNDMEYRGSWIWKYYDHDIPLTANNGYDSSGLLLNLDGPLVSTFDVSGLLAGSEASIFISENAFVKDINILSGAQVIGDIVSEWDPENPDIQHLENPNIKFPDSSDIQDSEASASQDSEAPDIRFPQSASELYTTLTFGLAADENGRAGAADDAFDMTLYGGIDGAKSIDMSLEAGRLAVTDAVNVHSLKNSGTLALYGANEDGFGATVTTTFENAEDAVLETGFSASGHVYGVQAASASLDGTWALRPVRDFYAAGAAITPESPVTVSGASETLSLDGFKSVVLAENASPTLNFTLADSSVSSPVVTVSRENDAYSRFADNAGARSLGQALYGVSGVAEGDMQNLIAALDWSGKDGSGVTRGLNALGPQAYDAAARATLSQMSEYSALVLRHLLADAPAAGEWRFWSTPYGSSSWQGGRRGASGWQSTGAGLLAGAEKRFDSGLAAGVHLAAGVRRTTLHGDAAQADVRTALLGTQALFAPQGWNGFYLAAQARLGVEDADMERTVLIGPYIRRNRSDWTALAGSAMLGAGRDWTWQAGEGTLSAGPLAFVEYAFLQRPGFSEYGEGASRLHLEGEYFASLPLTLGMHALWSTTLANGAGLSLDAMAAWQHELADPVFHTRASFRDYGDFSFSSATDTAGRDAMLLQGGVTLESPDRAFFMRLGVGGELFRDDASAAGASLSLGWKF